MPPKDKRAGRGRGVQGQSTSGGHWVGRGRAETGPSLRRRPPSSGGSAACLPACPESWLISARSSGKLGALGELRGGVVGATSATRGTSSSSVPPFPLPFHSPSFHRKCSPRLPKSEQETLEVIYSPLYHYIEKTGTGLGGGARLEMSSSSLCPISSFLLSRPCLLWCFFPGLVCAILPPPKNSNC